MQATIKSDAFQRDDLSLLFCIDMNSKRQESGYGYWFSKVEQSLNHSYHHFTEGVSDTEKSYQWLEKGGLKDRTEALIMEAQ